ncbi:MAG: hypothetical protein LBH19_09010, partial [Dysgonamonadaceae bacterium]|nr:hypothetical protein [Dysgonamonadaceae bacterium]
LLGQPQAEKHNLPPYKDKSLRYVQETPDGVAAAGLLQAAPSQWRGTKMTRYKNIPRESMIPDGLSCIPSGCIAR